MQTLPPVTTEPPAETALLTSEEFRALASRLYRKDARLQTLQCITGVINIEAVVLDLLAITWAIPHSLLWCANSLLLLNVLRACLIARNERQDKREKARILRFVSSTQDVNMLGSLLTIKDILAPAINDTHIFAHVINEAVLRLLPLVQTSHAPALNARQRYMLCHYAIHAGIIFPNDTNASQSLALSALGALEQVGDQECLPAVEYAFKADATTAETRAAAEHCAQVIRERLAREKGKDVLLRPDRKPEAVATLLRPSEERQEVPATLLRASQIGEATPDTLLRAHAAPASSPPEQLLRASRSEPDETGV